MNCLFFENFNAGGFLQVNKKKKKSNMVFIYLGIVIVLLVGIFSLGKLEKDNPLYGKPNNELNSATRELLNDKNYQNIILPEQLDQKIANKEDFFAYMFSASCHYCKETTPQIIPVVDELDIKLEQFNLLEFPEYQQKLGVEFTPTLIYFKDGVEADRLEGGIRSETAAEGHTVDDFRNFFEKYKS